jgi:hypothetical protein
MIAKGRIGLARADGASRRRTPTAACGIVWNDAAGETMHNRAAGIWVAFALCLGLIVGAPGIAAEQDEPAGSLREQVEREMLRYRVQIKNATVRLDQDLVGMDAGAPDPGAPPTPANLCCARNLKKMRGAYAKLTTLFGELEGCYAAEGAGSLTRLGTAKAELDELARKVEEFALAPGEREVEFAVQRMTIAYLRLRGTVDALEPCPADGTTAPAARPEDGGKSEPSETSESDGGGGSPS